MLATPSSCQQCSERQSQLPRLRGASSLDEDGASAVDAAVSAVDKRFDMPEHRPAKTPTPHRSTAVFPRSRSTGRPPMAGDLRRDLWRPGIKGQPSRHCSSTTCPDVPPLSLLQKS